MKSESNSTNSFQGKQRLLKNDVIDELHVNLKNSVGLIKKIK